METKIEVNKKTVTFFQNEKLKNIDNNNSAIPLVILNTFDEDGKEIWNECKKMNCKEFVFACISGVEWENEMAPWKIENVGNHFQEPNKRITKAIKWLLE